MPAPSISERSIWQVSRFHYQFINEAALARITGTHGPVTTGLLVDIKDQAAVVSRLATH
jgi:hypothetical protein